MELKLVKEISSGSYKLISDNELTTNTLLYIDRSDKPIYIEIYVPLIGDIILAKDMIKTLYSANGWSSFRNDKEKKSVARMLSYSLIQAELDEVLTSQEQFDSKIKYVKEARIARGNRWEYLREQVALNVNESDSYSFYTDTKGFKGDYIDASLPHLIMWLTSGIYVPLLIDYTSTGFASKSYYTAEMLQMSTDFLVDGKQYENN